VVIWSQNAYGLRSEMGNKYGARRTWSELCQREFASKAEATRGEELALLEKAGAISDLEYQHPFVLCKDPKITITVDFSYRDKPFGGPFLRARTYEDVKGVLTRDFRTKMAWLKEKYGIDVELVRR